ncbi:MAG: PAS domain S-box protein [Magnetococcus sp. DMHC-1]|nr:PAS domain S-box protein [Magnetococcales bacterium]
MENKAPAHTQPLPASQPDAASTPLFPATSPKIPADRFQNWVQMANSVILCLDGQGRVTYLNDFAQRLFGYSLSEIQGRPLVGTLVPERDGAGDPSQVGLTTINRSVESFSLHESEHCTKSGERLRLLWTRRTLLDGRGEPAEILCIGHDLRAHRHTEQSLRETEERNRILFESETDGIVVMDATTMRIEDCNPAMAKMLGHSRAELLSLKMTDFSASPVDTTSVQGACDKGLSEDGRHIPLCYLRRKDGSTFPVEISTGSFVSQGEKKLIGAFRDIQKRLLREAELKKFRNLIDHAGDAFFVIDPHQGHILDANRTAWTTLGYTRDELLQLTVTELQGETVQITSWEDHVRDLRTSGTLSVEGVHRRKDGSSFPVEIKSRIVDAGEGSLILASARDITERKKVEAALIQTKEEAEEASRLKDKFVSLVAHDLRAPLSSIMSLLEFLQEDRENPLTEEQKELLGDVLSSGRNLTMMIEEILNIGRLKSGKIRLEKRFFDGHFLVEDAIQKLEYISRKKGLQITNQIPEESRLYGDPALLGEVVQNLLSNAVKFSHPNGRIQLISPPDDATAIAVLDYGVGIPPEVLPKLFQIEEKVSTQGTMGETGTGFGLPFSFDIMKAHGGRLEAQSELGAGTTFTIWLPPLRPRVLVVDDGAMDRVMISAFLEALDVSIHEAGSGQEALAMIARELPHLIITDIAMPEMDGFQLIKELKKKPETEAIPVILITGDDKTETRDRAFRLGAVDFAVKPVVVHDFLPRVRHIIS